jgi:hypothetical protein
MGDWYPVAHGKAHGLASLGRWSPFESAIRTLIRDRLALPGFPQILLQLGLAHTTRHPRRVGCQKSACLVSCGDALGVSRTA